MMGILKSQELYTFAAQREALDDEIAAFAREFAQECGEPLSTDWYFDSWSLYSDNNTIVATFIDSYQGGEDKHHVTIPIRAFDDADICQQAIDARKAKIAESAEFKKAELLRRDKAELERLSARIVEAQGYSVQEQADGTHAVFHGQGFVRGGFKERWEALSFARDRADEAEEAGVPASA